jgi:hypothetical protein
LFRRNISKKIQNYLSGEVIQPDKVITEWGPNLRMIIADQSVHKNILNFFRAYFMCDVIESYSCAEGFRMMSYVGDHKSEGFIGGPL